MLHEHAYAPQFGTFLGNRARLEQFQKIMSLWSWLNRSEELSKFWNSLSEADSHIIWPCMSLQEPQLWESAFLRWNRPKFLEKSEELMIDSITFNKEIQAKVTALRRELAQQNP